MKRILRIIETASNIGAVFSAIFMILIVCLIAVEIFLRALFNTSTLIADEYSAYMFVFVVMLGLSYTFKEKGHIRITIITSRLGEKARNYLETVVLFVVLAILVFSIYHSAMMVYDTYSLDMRADTIAETPLYIPQIALPIGYTIFALQILGEILKKFIKEDGK
ncbi:TRAP transporter small permease [Deferribacter autotrophicus]|uniref:TRAP transporter small permease n=1 Tax=Deferribacter autotrophicus TaxID=500465 RepID=A0A5A8F556_9BACT|nr:TRAP transporter small permease [Deferribacter autotrophicus]KAA0256987.1 TRAP transporter small permease [Deferribacter autotrophicus]